MWNPEKYTFLDFTLYQTIKVNETICNFLSFENI